MTISKCFKWASLKGKMAIAYSRKLGSGLGYNRSQAVENSDQAIYAAMVDHMDQAVGNIIKALKRTKQFENTLIIFMIMVHALNMSGNVGIQPIIF